MTKNLNSNSQPLSSALTPTRRVATPSSEFYSSFSEEEVLRIIQAIEVKREIPLKYSYKGRGAKIWDNFYLKYIIPRWYRSSNVEIGLLRDNFEYLNGNLQNCKKVNIVDVGAGNSYPVKAFIQRLNKLGKVNKYIALDISEELLDLSRRNFRSWFPLIEFESYSIDIETSCLPKTSSKDQADIETDEIAKIILHLGVTIGNHQNRLEVLKNFKNSMGKHDLLVLTNETGSNAQWDGRVRGGFNYHAEQVYTWLKNNIGIRLEDCELVRKYDLKRDSMVANMRILHDYTVNFSFRGIDKTIEIADGEEITIWRHHKHELPELRQELEQAGLQLVHYSTNKYSSHFMAICQVASN